ncbi:uncharacterized protein LOC141504346 [Macrotis lagotis]|uniref:uncharacterized protein LOC141504346 n=1 Tax=Macrotis lagotis TaxID=92651 RepID=UPI003D69134A
MALTYWEQGEKFLCFVEEKRSESGHSDHTDLIEFLIAAPYPPAKPEPGPRLCPSAGRAGESAGQRARGRPAEHPARPGSARAVGPERRRSRRRLVAAVGDVEGPRGPPRPSPSSAGLRGPRDAPPPGSTSGRQPPRFTVGETEAPGREGPCLGARGSEGRGPASPCAAALCQPCPAWKRAPGQGPAWKGRATAASEAKEAVNGPSGRAPRAGPRLRLSLGVFVAFTPPEAFPVPKMQDPRPETRRERGPAEAGGGAPGGEPPRASAGCGKGRAAAGAAGEPGAGDSCVEHNSSWGDFEGFSGASDQPDPFSTPDLAERGAAPGTRHSPDSGGCAPGARGRLQPQSLPGGKEAAAAAPRCGRPISAMRIFLSLSFKKYQYNR